MILECPACTARFLVANSMIPREGRTVRCGKCSHQWFVENPEAEPTPLPDSAAAMAEAAMEAASAPIPDVSAQVPAVKKRRMPTRPFKIAAPVIAALWVVLALFAYFPQWQEAPMLRGIYHALGTTNTEGLIFSDVHMERSQTAGGKTQFILTGSIANHAATTRMVPTVRVKLKDAKGATVWSHEYDVNAELKAGEVYPFRIANVETSFASNVTSIVLDVGHSLQLMMRA